MFSSIATTPAKQSVGDTITTYCGRLTTATLVEDRRAAIQGLRSFAKDYPASVASGALRNLIERLRQDGDDPAIVRLILETLLLLFNHNNESAEASDELALWLADEFATRQENITLLLDLLESTDALARLYSLQLIQAIIAARTQECVSTAPLGISRLVAALDDIDQVRDEAIILLTQLTQSSREIQELVTYESAFEKLYNIMVTEGGLAEGTPVVKNCLELLCNLLQSNPRTRSLFRESQLVPKMSELLKATTDQAMDEQLAARVEQRNMNIIAFFAMIRLFLVPGSDGLSANQVAFARHRLLFHALQLAFQKGDPISVRSEALAACADMIRGQAELQQEFALLQVPSPLDDMIPPKHSGEPTRPRMVYIIDGLLDLVLAVHSLPLFDLRKAACECLKAYFYNHTEVRSHFLNRAIAGHASGADDVANVLTTVLRPDSASLAADPYRHWFAACLMLHLLWDCPTLKELARAVTEGDAESGEEVVTCIQTISAHVVTSINRLDDPRVVVGYLMLLIVWLFEDLEAVNDFLSETSNLQGLITAMIQHAATMDPLVQGLCAVLLGIIYEFSTKDSSIQRKDVLDILNKRLGREAYINRLSTLRSDPLMCEFEVLPQRLEHDGELPVVFFDSTFVDFFKDNYRRLVRAMDRDPGEEISVLANGVQKGVSRELVDTLRAQNSEQERLLNEARAQLESVTSQLSQEQAAHSRLKEASAADLSRLTQASAAQQHSHAVALQELQARHEAATRSLRVDWEQRESNARKSFEQQMTIARAEAARKDDEWRRVVEAQKRSGEAELADLKATISRLQVEVMKASKAREAELAEAREQAAESVKAAESQSAAQAYKVEVLEKKLEDAREENEGLEAELDKKDKKIEEYKKNLKEKDAQAIALLEELKSITSEQALAKTRVEEMEVEKQTVQTELDDLLIVFSDLEEKVSRYKKKLSEQGITVSDDEEEEEEDADESDSAQGEDKDDE